MFTGLVEEVGTVTHARTEGGDLRLHIQAQQVTEDANIGDSINVSGVCLTVVQLSGSGFETELMQETVSMTAPRWEPGARVNLERAMPASGRFGGHVVAGHVHGTGTVTDVQDDPGAFIIRIRADDALARYLVPKGSVTVDGVSLTVVDTGGPGGSRSDFATSEFSIGIIPHTRDVTTLGELKPGSVVNLEADMMALYLDRQRQMDGARA